MTVIRVAISSVVVAMLYAPHATAGGLLLPGHGPVAISRAGAAVASIDDPSAIAVNPAGLAGIHGNLFHLGAALIDFHQTFTREGVYEETGEDLPWEGQPYPSVSDASRPAIGLGPFQAVPLIAVATDLGGKVRGLVVAAGVYAPTGYPSRAMGADYVIEDPSRPPPPTRYDTVEQDAMVVLPSIAAGYRVSARLDLGGRFSFGVAKLEARSYMWGKPNLEEWAGNDAQMTLAVKDSFVPGFGLGVRYRVSDAIELGFAFDSKLSIHAKGTSNAVMGSGNTIAFLPVRVAPNNDDPLCERGGSVGAIKTCVDLALPMIAALGARYVHRDRDGAERGDLEVDVQYEAWRDASDYLVTADAKAGVGTSGILVGVKLMPATIRHQLRDTVSARLGGSWRQPIGAGAVTFRGGVAYDTAAAAPGWQRLDLDGAARLTAAAGVSTYLSNVRIDVGAGLVHEGTRRQGAGCNPASTGDGCGAGGAALPPDQRVGPDPAQPTANPLQESPFNGGTLTSGYLLLMVGMTTSF